MNWDVKRYEGTYPERQDKANKDGAVCYVELHLNALSYDGPDQEDNPTFVITAHNGSEKSHQWGSYFARQIAEEPFSGPLFKGSRAVEGKPICSGVLQREYKKAGDYSLRFFDRPCILIEPYYVSDYVQAKHLLTPEAKKRIASILFSSIQNFFPTGGLIGLSVGHLNNPARPGDRGAPLNKQVSNPHKYAEADICNEIAIEFEALVVGETLHEGGCECPNCGTSLRMVMA